MLKNDRQTFTESEGPGSPELHTVEFLTGSAGLLVTLLVLYLIFFDGRVVF